METGTATRGDAASADDSAAEGASTTGSTDGESSGGERTDSEPDDGERADGEHTDAEPVDHEPIDHEPIDHEPIDHEPVDGERADVTTDTTVLTVPAEGAHPPPGGAQAGSVDTAGAAAPATEPLAAGSSASTAPGPTWRRWLARCEERRWWPHRWWTRTLAVIAAVVVLLGVVATPSLIHAMVRPGNDSTAARLAEWGRDHGFGPLITWLEARQYDLHQPPTGGAPARGIPKAAGSETDHPGGQPAPPPLPPPAGLDPLPDEGQWQTVVSTPRGDAARLASVRPDAQHTSFVVGVLWMDPTLVHGVLHPGTEDPGGHWSTPTSADPEEQRTLITAFSAGFRLNGDSHGGWWSEGREARPLVPGAASMVVRKDGTVDVGAWGSEVSMGPDVASVRQNLIPLVDKGVVNPTCATGGTKEWGSTVGQAAYISRSAFGVTATGAMVYVAGPALSVCTLGELMRSAGVVRGMELDINPAWTSGYYFHPNGRPHPDAFKMFDDEQVGSQHYLQTSGRDFFTFDLRSIGDTAGTPPATQHRGRSGGNGRSGDNGDRHGSDPHHHH